MMRALALAGLLIGWPLIASAHPEDAVLIRLLVGMDNGKVTHIGESWTFDPSVSKWLLQNFDANSDDKFEPDELKKVLEATRENTPDSFFYTRIWKGQTQLPDPKLYGFQATVKDGVVTLAFALALAVPEDPNALRIEMYDPQNLTGLVPVEDNPVVLRGTRKGQTCVPNIAVMKPDAHGGPDDIPIALTLACSG
ncbi:hypothetical protein DL1_15485 [Thioclava dalianensis]|uniref:EF-hand domain-containing protein n=1 Tax=Thioclava dalianensis TaxID=1185766 RepID=A0A074TG81_9RHOB|nr:DUF1007 family protein [Thioclava dalianensis]KEP70706.1 hypothetical protein DL1_15485 [Thioclava dalianensis]SFN08454.1 tRNA threonylcarbamoyladenosine biosynthesis protein TsaE [Thioclava dalianensis]